MIVKQWARGFVLACGLLALLGVHNYLGGLPRDAVSPLFFFDRVFDLVWASAIVLTALGLGRWVLRKAGVVFASLSEEFTFAFGIGTGVASALLLGFGFLRWLYAPILIGVLLIGLLSTRREWLALMRAARACQFGFDARGVAERWLSVALVLMIAPVVLGALVPPTDVDALGYHLVAPALFLKQHAIVPAFDNIGVNYPMSADLLYSLGLAVGSDQVAQLIHFAFAFATTLGVYAFATRYFNRAVGLLAMIAFWASPIVGLEASAPIIDLAWTFYEFLALFAFFRWRDSRQTRDLVLAGIAMGLALTTKYLAAIGFVALVGSTLLVSWRAFPRAWRMWLQHISIVGLATSLVALPWYVKNWVWLGNPVYPFFFGAYGLDGTLHSPTGALGGLGSWVGMGLGHDLGALIRFPWNVYVNWQYFGSPVNRGGPTWLFLFLPLYIFLPKRAIVNWVLLICGARFGVWWLYTHNLRYLVIIFPWLALASAWAIATLMPRLPRPALRFGLGVVVGIFIAVGIFLQWGFVFVLRENALGFIAGSVSRDEYLRANLLDYPATRFMNTQLPPSARILAIGDARVYYLERRTIPDEGHENLPGLIALGRSPAGIAALLQSWSVGYIWISEDDLKYHRAAWNLSAARDDLEIFEQFREYYLVRIYTDASGHSIYELR